MAPTFDELRCAPKLVTLALSCAFAVGCSNNTRAVTSGEIGCPAREITISEEKDETGWSTVTSTWTAACRGRTYYCSSLGSKSDSQISCKEAAVATSAAAPGSAPPAESGCHYDTQCKGDRICTSGKCVEPGQQGVFIRTPDASAAEPEADPAAMEPAQLGWETKDAGVAVPDDWRSCAGPDDCQLVVTTCCDQCNGGKAVSVAKSHVADVRAKLKPVGCGACTKRGCSTRPFCDGGRCVLQWQAAR